MHINFWSKEDIPLGQSFDGKGELMTRNYFVVNMTLKQSSMILVYLCIRASGQR